MVIKCCFGCVAPKRHTACWGHCPDYLAEKEEYKAKKAKDDQRRNVKNSIYTQRTDKVVKAERRHGRKI
jgi:hypothetical protein